MYCARPNLRCFSLIRYRKPRFGPHALLNGGVRGRLNGFIFDEERSAIFLAFSFEEHYSWGRCGQFGSDLGLRWWRLWSTFRGLPLVAVRCDVMAVWVVRTALELDVFFHVPRVYEIL